LRAKVLLTSDEVMFHAPTDEHMDPRTILQNIIIAERRFIKPAIGTSIYNTLVTNKNILVTPANVEMLTESVNADREPDRETLVLHPGDYVNSDFYLNEVQQDLWREHLAKVAAEAVWLVSMPVNRIRSTAKGLIKNFPEIIGPMNGEATSADLRDMKHLMDRGLQDRVSVLLDDLHEYMCTVSFTGYTRDCGCGKVPSKKADIVFGLYDDDPRRCGCGSNYEEESSSGGSGGFVGDSSGCQESIPFVDVSFIDIPLTPARKVCNPFGLVIQVEVINEDGEPEVLNVPIQPDSLVNPTMYHVDLGGPQTGRVLF
jgi:hypothetical protein